MKKKYEEPNMEITMVDALSNVVTASSLYNGGENGRESEDDFNNYWGSMN